MKRTRIRSRDGVTLMEVLASLFVISIGLLGVLAVIPFGAFQVAKGRNAEHVSNMLAAAGQDVKIAELANVKSWVTPSANYQINANDGTQIFNWNGSNTNSTLDCTRFYMIDPFDDSNTLSNRFHKVGTQFSNPATWREIMRSQDDLVFTVHKDKRTDFSGQGNRVASSGKYTWFMTFAPPDSDNGTNLTTTTDLDDLNNTLNNNAVTVDLLGCYNRIPGDSSSEREVSITTHQNTLNGAQLTLNGTQEELDLSKTKYIFVNWPVNNGTSPQFQFGGLWCKVVYAPKNIDSATGTKTIVVSGNFTSLAATQTNVRALIIDGILYHKQLATPLALFDP